MMEKLLGSGSRHFLRAFVFLMFISSAMDMVAIIAGICAIVLERKEMNEMNESDKGYV